MPFTVLRRLRLEAEKSPLVLPVLTGIAAILWTDGCSLFLFVLLAGMAVSLLLQGIKGAVAALLLSLALGGLHEFRTGEYARWQRYLQQETSLVFSGSAIKSASGRLILEGYPVQPHTELPLSPCKLEVILPAPRSAKQETAAFPTGRRYEVRGQILPERPRRNPGEFDRSSWLKREGIHASMQAHSLEDKGAGSWKSRILAASADLNAFLCRRLDRGMEPGDPRTEVVKSLVLGARSEASRETVDLFRYSGLLHIFAVSGLHVGLVALLFSPLLLLMGLRPRAFCIVLSLILLFYTFATGLSVSASRAAFMLIVILAGIAFTRKNTAANRLALAALLLLLWDSQSLFQLGFLLSFLIFATVVAAASSFSLFDKWLRPDDYIPPLLYTKWEKGKYAAGKYLFGTLFISLSAWAAAAIILTPATGYLSPYTPAVNTLLTLPVSLLMAGGLLALVLGGIPLLGPCLAACNQHLAGLLVSLASFSLTLPGAITPLTPHASAGQMTIFSLNGTDYAAAMGNPALLLDCGTESGTRHILIPGLMAEGYTPGLAVLPYQTEIVERSAALLRERYKNLLIRFPAPSLSVQNSLWDNGSGGKLILLDLPLSPARRKAENTPVFLWEYEGRKILFFGDAGYNAEKRLMKNHPGLHADALVLGQHSADYSATPDFIRFLSPRLIVHTSPAPFVKEHRLLSSGKNQQEKTNLPLLWDLQTQGAIRFHLSPEKFTWESAR